MKKILITVSVFVCSVSAFSQNDDKANVLAVERNTANAFTKHDVVALNAAFADDANVISANGSVLNKQQIMQSVQNVNSVTLSDLQVRIEGYTAIVTGVENETGRNDNGAYENKMRFTDVLLKTKGVWKIIASQATLIQ
ncbi:MAG TPA: nuclear transport factor 2 family protein [Parafilimonas sp.]|nr:nuclear transport factor 2 family protein [Parafilimonas sp.]